MQIVTQMCTVTTHLPRPVAVGLERFTVVHIELRPARTGALVGRGAIAPVRNSFTGGNEAV